MLYKKVHRQYLRRYRVGRKFKYGELDVLEVTGKPHINYSNGTIGVMCDDNKCWSLIIIADYELFYQPVVGEMLDKVDVIEWLN